MLRLSTDDIRLATGVALSIPQAEALQALQYSYLRPNGRSLNVLRRLGLADIQVYTGKRGGRRYVARLTTAGLRAVDSLNDACEFSPHCASVARLARISVEEAYRRQEEGYAAHFTTES